MSSLKGGARAEAILASITRGRFRSAALARASRTIGELQWRPAQSCAIQLDDQRTTWHSGHIHAVLSDGDSVVAGSDTGGVWLIKPIVGPSYRAGYQAIPLSDRWVNAGVGSLAFGPDGRQHVFAGTAEAAALNLIAFDVVMGSLVPVYGGSDITIPLPFTTNVFAIVVFENPRRIAIGTNHGVWWSEIPAAIGDGDAYDWHQAAGLPGGQATSLARGPGMRLIAVGATPSGPLGIGTAPIVERLFAGGWQDGTLTFAAATLPPIAEGGACLFRVASCRSEPQRAYAIAADENGDQLQCVLRSDDGGQTWAAVSVPQGAGERGFHNRAIGVSAHRPDVVAVGWQHGPFLSTDGGMSWTLLDGGNETGVNGLPCPGRRKGRHADIQSLYFPPLDRDELYIGSDGGVLCTRDLGRCFDSQYNRNLAVLQFYGPGHAGSTGTLSVSNAIPGLLTGGTQDNGNIALVPDKDAGSAWHKFAGGDGGMTRIVDPLRVVLHVNSDEPRVRMSKWSEARREFAMNGDLVPRLEDHVLQDDGVDPTIMETVIEPVHRRLGQLMYAVAGTADGDVFGFFANPDGTEAAFVKVANVGGPVSALASLNGTEILVGRSDGTIVAVDTMSGLWSVQIQDATVAAPYAASRIEIQSASVAYALKRGTLLRYSQQRWTALPAEREWKIFTVERDGGRLFAAVDTDVFSSSDGGITWKDASAGLPVSPQCTDLRIGDDGDGGRTLYLTTYGRSVWRASITLPPPKGLDLDLPPLVKDVLFGVLQDGGGLVRIGGRVVPIPPRGPAVDLLAGLAILQTARTMSPESAREIGRTTLRQMLRAIERAMNEIE